MLFIDLWTAHTNAHTCPHVHEHTWTYVYIHTCTQTCTHIRKHAYTLAFPISLLHSSCWELELYNILFLCLKFKIMYDIYAILSNWVAFQRRKTLQIPQQPVLSPGRRAGEKPAKNNKGELPQRSTKFLRSSPISYANRVAHDLISTY